MFEPKSQPLLPRKEFAKRLARSGIVGMLLVAISLGIGMLGYHVFEGLSWIDAFLNAAMLLGGMGPVNSPNTFNGKLFAGLYALYCGLLVIIVASILLAPVVHRAFHKFHLSQSKS